MKGLWIKSFSNLKDNIKTRRLSRRLNLSIADVIGRLHMLWWWVIEHDDSGDMSGLKAFEIEDVMMWDGEEGALFSALVECGFIDDDADGCRVHDWSDYAGAVVARREQIRNAKRRYDAKNKQGLRNDYVNITESSRNHIEQNRTEQNRTEQNRAEQNRTDAYASADCVRFPAAAAAAETEKYETKIDKVISAWNEQLVPLGFKAVQKASPSRKRAFCARLAEDKTRDSLAWWEDVFIRVACSDFMRDSAESGAPWMSFDWLLNEDNLVKLLEGKYDNSDNPKAAKKQHSGTPGNPHSGTPGNPRSGTQGNPRSGAPGNPRSGTPGNPQRGRTYTGMTMTEYMDAIDVENSPLVSEQG